MMLKNRVHELRQRQQLRQSDLASRIGVTRQTILAIEKGRLNPSITICLKIARVLQEPVDYVFYLERADDAAVVSNGKHKGANGAATNGHDSGKKSSEGETIWEFI